MLFTKRDYHILFAIHAYDGILSVDQIHRWFFGALRLAQARLSLLYQQGYIQRIQRDQRHLVPKPIIWLNILGAQTLAGQQEIPFCEFHWRSTPRWSKVSHDIGLNEFRHTMEQAVARHPMYSIDYWYGQDELLRLIRKPIEYLNGRKERQKRLVRPDGYFSLSVQDIHPHRLHFFVEFDNATESNSRFARDKVYPTVQFVHSKVYQEAMNTKIPARFLVIVNGPKRRLHNMRRDVAQAGGAGLFLFTHAAHVTIETALTGNIWQLAHTDTQFSLETYDTEEFQQTLRESSHSLPQPKLLPQSLFDFR